MRARYACIVSPFPIEDFSVFDGKVGAIAVSRQPAPFNMIVYSDSNYSAKTEADQTKIIFGQAFPYSDSQDQYRPSANERSIKLSWGGYVMVTARPDGSVEVLRDAGAHIPCYYFKDGDILLIASDVDLLSALHGRAFDVDWDIVGSELRFPTHFGRPTALTGVMELMPGEALQISPTGFSTTLQWNPAIFAAGSAPMNFVDAVDLLSQALDVVMRMLAHHYPRSLLTVSGGLDSSIVASEYHRCSGRGDYITFYTDDPIGDERPFSRALAVEFGADLIEIGYKAPTLSQFLDARSHLPRPTHKFIGDLISASLRDAVLHNGADAILNGYGGDNIFCFLRSSLPLVDRLKSRPKVFELFKTLDDISQLSGATWLQVAAQVIGYLWRGQLTMQPAPNMLLNRDLGSKPKPELQHPWISAASEISLGKCAHIASIVRAHRHLEQFSVASSVVNISPLLLTPVVEACLTIPTWLWCDHGIDRAVARHAARSLPSYIQKRRSKSSPIPLHATFFDNYRSDLIDLIRNGRLAKAGLIDLDQLNFCSDAPLQAKGADFMQILDLVDAELWSCSWN